MRPRFVIAGCLAVLSMAAAALAPAPLAAQTSTGTVRGYVRGTGGAPVPQATVVVRDVGTNQQRATQTNESGFYSIGGLRPARYELTARRVGMQPATRTIQVGIGQTIDVNLSLSEQAVTLTAVEVTAAPAEETRTSEVATNISTTQIENLPNFERNFLDIARLAPGITARNVNSTDKVIAAAGQPAEAVNVFVDGATYKNDVLRGGVVGQDASKGNPFPQGAVQEFRIITQQYKAEYQKAASAIITATTKSGTNAWEVDAFAYGVGSNWVARDAFTASRGGPRPTYERLQAGGSVGGPLIRDRLFFFGTYELNFRDEPFNVFFGGDSALAPIDLRNQLRPLTGQFTQEFRQHLGFGKLTWLASDRSTIDASFTIRTEDDLRGFQQQTSPESAETMNVDVYTGVLNWRWAGERWLNEAQVSGQTFIWNPTWTNGDLVGRDFQGLLRVGGKDTQQDFQQDRISLRNDVTRSGVRWLGDHVFKAGANVDFLSYSSEKRFFENPVFRYRQADNWARPFEASFGFGDPTVETDNTQFGFYVQDDWQVTPRLVLNLGIRWDAETNMINNDYVTPQALADSLRGLDDRLFVEQPLPGGGVRQVRVIDQLGGLDRYITRGSEDREMYLKAWQPRVGASYDVFGDGRTVLFGGYGIYYDRNYWNTLLDEQFRRQYAVLSVSFRDVCTPADPANCVVWDERYFDPAQLRQLSGTAGLPEVFLVANDLTPPRTDQFSAGIRQQLGAFQITASYNGVRGKNYMNFVRASQDNSLGPNYRQLFITDDRVRTWYDALQLQIQKPVTEDTRWGGGLSYTLSRSEEQGQSTDLFWGFDARFPTVADRPRRRAPGDQRHNIIANGIFKLPADFTFSTIVSLGSGITVNATDNSLGSGVGQSRTYVFTPPSKPFLGIGHVFATQNVDLRLEKAFQVAGNNSVGLVLDLFNAFNNANYGCFNTTINPLDGPPNENYGKPGCAGLGRRLQVGLRYGYRGSGAQ